MTRFTQQSPITGLTTLEERIRRLEEEVREINNRWYNSFIIGRLRTDRTAPTDSADVQPPDLLYDVVRDTSYQYVLINDGGTLTWLRWAYSTF